MKKLMFIAVLLALCVLQQGCIPNARKGLSQDIINHETENISKIDPQIYKVNKRVVPLRMDQVDDIVSQQGRMEARIKAWKESR